MKLELFKFEENDSGVTHFLMAQTEELARNTALRHANLMRGDSINYLTSKDIEKIDISQDEKFTFFSDSNPVTLTVREWETVYEVLEETRYLACSEY